MIKRIKRKIAKMIEHYYGIIAVVCIVGMAIGQSIIIFSCNPKIDVSMMMMYIVGIIIFFLSLTCLGRLDDLWLECVVDVDDDEDYTPSQMIGKYFTYDGKRYIIYQYVCNGQDDESCFFKCRLVDIDEYIIWHEEELKKAIALNDIEVEA